MSSATNQGPLEELLVQAVGDERPVQRAVQDNDAGEVARLYAERSDADVIVVVRAVP